MAKGIRVNQLAKELGVESKSILQKLKDEGLGDAAPNHMSTLALGLAETVREWVTTGQIGGGGGVAVETAASVDVALKTKPSRSRKKKEEPTAEAPPVAEVVPAEATPATPVGEAAPKKAPAAPKAPPTPVTIDISEKPAVVIPTPVAAIAPPAVKPPPPPEVPPAPLRAVATAAPTTPPATPGAEHIRPTRPTVTLANRSGPSGQSVVERRPVVQAPQLTSVAPAKIQGPRVVRIEKEEVVDTRGPRQPRPGGMGEAPPISPAGPRGGRGVKVSDDEESEEAKKKTAGNKKSLSTRRRGGVDGRRGEANEKIKEFTEADLIARRDALNAAAASRNVFDTHLRQIEKRGTHMQAKTITQRGEPVTVTEPITVRSLATALGIKSNEIQGKLLKQGVAATVNQTLERATAESVAMEFGIELKIAEQETLEQILIKEIEARPVDEKKLRPRPPVVTILGHVDHGKTSLLDKIRNANVAAGEAGGITQHTAAWMVQLGAKRVTFIDTPGHQAFTSMRARGANMTDVVVLVVSAAEGVQPQTIESINHARAAGVPIVVALNKIDRADANPDMVLGQLAANGLNPVKYGGEIEVVPTSAITGQGIPELIEILDLQSQIMDLKADPTAPARGVVIESRMEAGLGAVATVLIQNGTLNPGDIGLAGAGFGRIRSLLNDRSEAIADAGPSMPVIVSGLNELPLAGDKFYALDDMDRARAVATERLARQRQSQLSVANKVTLDNLLETMAAADTKTINLIVKGDVQGSVETLAKTVGDYNTNEVRVRVIHSGVGPINESDVELASASKAVVIGFNVVPDEKVRQMAEQLRVELRLYRVIYEIFDDLKKALSGLLEPEVREKMHGHAEVRKVYRVSKIGNVAGCFVTDGHIQRGSKIRLIRDGTVVTEDLSIESLKRLKDDTKEVKAGLECGIKLAGYDDVKLGDVLEAYIREMIQRTL